MENETKTSEDSFEKLEVEEIEKENENENENENEKEISIEEDLLGAQSLMVSDSDGEGDGDDEGKGADDVETRTDDVEPNADELASDDVKSESNVEKPDTADEDLDIDVAKSRKSVRKVLSSDEDETEEDKDKDLNNFPEEGTNKTETEKEEKKKKKFSSLIDSESEEEPPVQSPLKQSNLDVEDQIKQKKKKVKKMKKSSKEGKKSKDLNKNQEKSGSSSAASSDNESASDSDDKTKKKKKTKKLSKISSLIDSDDESSARSSDDESQKDKHNAIEDELSGNEAAANEPKKVRASAKKALDEMQLIQSQQQKLHREAHISVPYHKPKKYTLQEFLQRRTIIKASPMPSTESSQSGSLKYPPKSLKMTPEELEEYAKFLEERAKEATEFFKSESESEEETAGEIQEKPAELADSKEPAPEQPEVNVEPTNETSETLNAPLASNTELDLLDDALMDEFNDNDFAEEEEEASGRKESHTSTTAKSPVKILITEVLELPKLDLSASNIKIDQISPRPSTSPLISPSTSTAAAAPSNRLSSTAKSPSVNDPMSSNPLIKTKQMLEDRLTASLKQSPALKGSEDMLIDLDSGEIIPKKPTGVENLLQRLMANKKVRKDKKSECVNILSVDHGKVEISKVSLHLHEDPDPIVADQQKPGAAYFKLKNDLKSLITKKRLEVLQQKRAEEQKQRNGEEGEQDNEEGDVEMLEYEPESKETSHQKKIVVDEDENAIVIDEDENNEEVDAEEDDAVEINSDDDEDGVVEVPSEERTGNKKAENGEVIVTSDEDDSSSSDEDPDLDDEDVDDGKSQRKNRIIKAFQNDSDSDEDRANEKKELTKDESNIDFLKTPKVDKSSSSLLGAASHIAKPGLGVLFDGDPNKTIDEEENELAALCSGRFEETQKVKAEEREDGFMISQIPETQHNLDSQMADDELLKLCSGSFEATQAPQTQLIAKHNKILSSDEEEGNDRLKKPDIDDDNPEEEDETKALKTKVKKLTKRIKKGQVKLGFSDDEDEDDVEANADEDDDVEVLEEEEEQPEAFVDYDSEENEIVVEMTKKDRVMKAANFVENEAELSESEWGSADEDEKNLDSYDIELGDEEQFDKEQLRDEIGRIHIRKILDEDVREVKKLQEMFVEDEEVDGVGRQRQFRWKNAETGFSLDTTDRNADEDNGGEDSGGEENEHIWRKIRFEREQLLKEQNKFKDSDDTSLTLSSRKSLSISLAAGNGNSPNTTSMPKVKKLNIISTAMKTKLSTTATAATTATTMMMNTLSSNEKKKNSPFLISKTIQSFNRKPVRGSFLVRDKETLNKLAGLTKGNGTSLNTESMGAAGTVSVKNAIAKNFVFATLTEEEHESLKRKADDLLNSSTENGINYMKKPKVEARRDTCFIDQLL